MSLLKSVLPHEIPLAEVLLSVAAKMMNVFTLYGEDPFPDSLKFRELLR